MRRRLDVDHQFGPDGERLNRRDPIHLNRPALHRHGRFCVTQDVRGITAPLARAAGAALGKGAFRPLSNPLMVASREAIETSRRFIPANDPRRLITRPIGASGAYSLHAPKIDPRATPTALPLPRLCPSTQNI